MVTNGEDKDCNLTGYFTIQERKQVEECMKEMNLFKFSHFVREAVLEKVDKVKRDGV